MRQEQTVRKAAGQQGCWGGWGSAGCSGSSLPEWERVEDLVAHA